MLTRKSNSASHYSSSFMKYLVFALISFSAFVLLTCKSEKKANEMNTLSEAKSVSERGTSSDFDISGQYYAGFYKSSYDPDNQTGFYPNTYPKTNVRLEILQFYPNWREITVKLHVEFYIKNTNDGRVWFSKGRVLGMGTGTLTPGTGFTNAGSYTVNFVVEDYFIDSGELPTTSAMKFTFDGKVAQFSSPTSDVGSTPISSNTFLSLTGTMTIVDNSHVVFSSSTTMKNFAAKRWRTETFQPF
ncbi:MAG: hypothetical protein ILNGONEN_02005 [Syntrophorhabdaceae bacterium]|nr:hypothetical protein [Syntrophorhabdaceae bacterium]